MVKWFSSSMYVNKTCNSNNHCFPILFLLPKFLQHSERDPVRITGAFSYLWSRYNPDGLPSTELICPLLSTFQVLGQGYAPPKNIPVHFPGPCVCHSRHEYITLGLCILLWICLYAPGCVYAFWIYVCLFRSVYAALDSGILLWVCVYRSLVVCITLGVRVELQVCVCCSKFVKPL